VHPCSWHDYDYMKKDTRCSLRGSVGNMQTPI
jgi:hypothetical protein